MTTRMQTDFSVDGAEVKWTEDILVVLERTAFMSCTHEVVVGRAAIAAAADGRSRLGTDVTPLAPHNTVTSSQHLISLSQTVYDNRRVHVNNSSTVFSRLQVAPEYKPHPLYLPKIWEKIHR